MNAIVKIVLPSTEPVLGPLAAQVTCFVSVVDVKFGKKLIVAVLTPARFGTLLLLHANELGVPQVGIVAQFKVTF